MVWYGVCVCVREREGERGRGERQRQRERNREKGAASYLIVEAVGMMRTDRTSYKIV